MFLGNTVNFGVIFRWKPWTAREEVYKKAGEFRGLFEKAKCGGYLANSRNALHYTKDS